jgi:hypothetical protein
MFDVIVPDFKKSSLGDSLWLVEVPPKSKSILKNFPRPFFASPRHQHDSQKLPFKVEKERAFPISCNVYDGNGRRHATASK